MRGHEALIDLFKELKVRSRVVKEMANLYVEDQLADLLREDSVIKLLAERRGDLRQQFRGHIALRVEAEYPDAEHGGEDGAVPQRIRATIAESLKRQQSIAHSHGFRPEAGHGARSATSLCRRFV